MTFKRSKLLPLYTFNRSITTFYGEPFFFGLIGSKTTTLLFTSFVQKTLSTIRRLMLCHKRFLTVTRKTRHVFTSVLCNKLFRILRTKIVKQWLPEKPIQSHILNHSLKTRQFLNQNIATCQILNQKFKNMSGFEVKTPQRVRFWNTFLTTRKILLWFFYDAWDFDMKILNSVSFWWNFLFKK